MKPCARLGAVLPAALVLAAGRAAGQCPNPALYDFGGQPGAVCAATVGTQVLYEAVARGRWVSIESSPLVSGSPSAVARVALDHPAVHLHTEIVGRVWATDGSTLYALDTNIPTNPRILGRITIPDAYFIERLRIRGNYVYAVDSTHLYVVDATNPGAPVLRASFQPSPVAFFNDLEVVGSYAYVAIDEVQLANSMMVVDISNPANPVEVRRVGNNNRWGRRLSKAANLGGLYALTDNGVTGAVEAWGLTNPANPSLLAVNATLGDNLSDSDELRATNTAVLHLQRVNDTLNIFNTSSLARIGEPIVLSRYGVNGLGVDAPFAFITRTNGELIRVNYTTSPPTVIDPYLDVAPGYTYNVLTLNEGFSVLSGSNELWAFATPNGAPPYAFAHLNPDATFGFVGHLALLTGGTLFAVEYGGSTSNPFSRILAYHVNGSPTPGVVRQGSFDVPGIIEGMDAGFDANNVRRVYYTTGGFGGVPGFLHILDATNLGAMSHTGSFALTSGVYGPVKFLNPGLFPPTPPRVVVGGSSRKTQIVSVASAGFPSSLGVIPSSSRAIAPGLPPTLWLIDENRLHAYDISTPAVPILQSSTRLARDNFGTNGVDLKTISPFANYLGVTTDDGDLIKINASSASAPVIDQIARVSSGNFFGGYLRGLTYDGTNLHLAAGLDGYQVYPFSFSAPPREDPSRALGLLGRHGIVAICPGTPLVATARFAAHPPVSGHQWLKFNPATYVYDPLVNGPTGTGSTVSGATTATLTISNPGVADQGLYACRAANTCGVAESDTGFEARVGGYANCDASTIQPVLNVNDFVCFLNEFAAGSPYFDYYPNCDGSTTVPLLNVNDFVCFQAAFAAGCS